MKRITILQCRIRGRWLDFMTLTTEKDKRKARRIVREKGITGYFTCECRIVNKKVKGTA